MSEVNMAMIEKAKSRVEELKELTRGTRLPLGNADPVIMELVFKGWVLQKLDEIMEIVKGQNSSVAVASVFEVPKAEQSSIIASDSTEIPVKRPRGNPNFGKKVDK